MTQSYNDEDYWIAVKRVSDCFNVNGGSIELAIHCGLKVLTGKNGKLEGVTVHRVSFETEGENTTGSVSNLSWDFSSPKLNALKAELWDDAQQSIKNFDKESFEKEVLAAATKNIIHWETFLGFSKKIAEDHGLSPTIDVVNAISERIKKATAEYQSAAA